MATKADNPEPIRETRKEECGNKEDQAIPSILDEVSKEEKTQADGPCKVPVTLESKFNAEILEKGKGGSEDTIEDGGFFKPPSTLEVLVDIFKPTDSPTDQKMAAIKTSELAKEEISSFLNTDPTKKANLVLSGSDEADTEAIQLIKTVQEDEEKEEILYGGSDITKNPILTEPLTETYEDKESKLAASFLQKKDKTHFLKEFKQAATSEDTEPLSENDVMESQKEVEDQSETLEEVAIAQGTASAIEKTEANSLVQVDSSWEKYDEQQAGELDGQKQTEASTDIITHDTSSLRDEVKLEENDYLIKATESTLPGEAQNKKPVEFLHQADEKIEVFASGAETETRSLESRSLIAQRENIGDKAGEKIVHEVDLNKETLKKVSTVPKEETEESKIAEDISEMKHEEISEKYSKPPCTEAPSSDTKSTAIHEETFANENIRIPELSANAENASLDMETLAPSEEMQKTSSSEDQLLTPDPQGMVDDKTEEKTLDAAEIKEQTPELQRKEEHGPMADQDYPSMLDIVSKEERAQDGTLCEVPGTPESKFNIENEEKGKGCSENIIEGDIFFKSPSTLEVLDDTSTEGVPPTDQETAAIQTRELDKEEVSHFVVSDPTNKINLVETGSDEADTEATQSSKNIQGDKEKEEILYDGNEITKTPIFNELLIEKNDGESEFAASSLQQKDGMPFQKDVKQVLITEDYEPVSESDVMDNQKKVEDQSETLEKVSAAQSNAPAIETTEPNSAIQDDSSKRKHDERQPDKQTEPSADIIIDATSSPRDEAITEHEDLSKATESTLLGEDSQNEKGFLHKAGEKIEAFASGEEMEISSTQNPIADQLENMGDKADDKIVDEADIKEETLEKVLTVPDEETESSNIAEDISETKHEEFSNKEHSEPPCTEAPSCDTKSTGIHEATFANENHRIPELSPNAENAPLDMQTPAPSEEMQKTSSSEELLTPDSQGMVDDKIEEKTVHGVENKELSPELQRNEERGNMANEDTPKISMVDEVSKEYENQGDTPGEVPKTLENKFNVDNEGKGKGGSEDTIEGDIFLTSPSTLESLDDVSTYRASTTDKETSAIQTSELDNEEVDNYVVSDQTNKINLVGTGPDESDSEATQYKSIPGEKEKEEISYDGNKITKTPITSETITEKNEDRKSGLAASSQQQKGDTTFQKDVDQVVTPEDTGPVSETAGLESQKGVEDQSETLEEVAIAQNTVSAMDDNSSIQVDCSQGKHDEQQAAKLKQTEASTDIIIDATSSLRDEVKTEHGDVRKATESALQSEESQNEDPVEFLYQGSEKIEAFASGEERESNSLQNRSLIADALDIGDKAEEENIDKADINEQTLEKVLTVPNEDNVDSKIKEDKSETNLEESSEEDNSKPPCIEAQSENDSLDTKTLAPNEEMQITSSFEGQLLIPYPQGMVDEKMEEKTVDAIEIKEQTPETQIKDECGLMTDQATLSILDEVPKEEIIQVDKPCEVPQTPENKFNAENEEKYRGSEDKIEGDIFFTSPSTLKDSGDMSTDKDSPTDQGMATIQTTELDKEEVSNFFKSDPTNTTNLVEIGSDEVDTEAIETCENIQGNIGEILNDGNEVTKIPMPNDPLPEKDEDKESKLEVSSPLHIDDIPVRKHIEQEATLENYEPISEIAVIESQKEVEDQYVTTGISKSQSNASAIEKTEENSSFQVEGSKGKYEKEKAEEPDGVLQTEASRGIVIDGTSSFRDEEKNEHEDLSNSTENTLLEEESQNTSTVESLHQAGEKIETFGSGEERETSSPPSRTLIVDKAEEESVDKTSVKEETLEKVLSIPNEDAVDSAIKEDKSAMKLEEFSEEEYSKPPCIEVPSENDSLDTKTPSPNEELQKKSSFEGQLLIPDPQGTVDEEMERKTIDAVEIKEQTAETQIKDECGLMTNQATVSILEEVPKEVIIQVDKPCEVPRTLENRFNTENEEKDRGSEDKIEGDIFLTLPSTLKDSGDTSTHKDSPTDQGMATIQTTELGKEEVSNFFKSDPTNITNLVEIGSDEVDTEATETCENIPGNIEEILNDGNEITKTLMPYEPLPEKNEDKDSKLEVSSPLHNDDIPIQKHAEQVEQVAILENYEAVSEIAAMERQMEVEDQSVITGVAIAQSNALAIEKTEENSSFQVEGSKGKHDKEQAEELDGVLQTEARGIVIDGTASLRDEVKNEHEDLSKATENTLLEEESQNTETVEFLHQTGEKIEAFGSGEERETSSPLSRKLIVDKAEEESVSQADEKEETLETVIPNEETEESGIAYDGSERKHEELSKKEHSEPPCIEASTSDSSDTKLTSVHEPTFANEDLRIPELSENAESDSLDTKTPAPNEAMQKTSSFESRNSTPDPDGIGDDNIEEKTIDAVEMKGQTPELQKSETITFLNEEIDVNEQADGPEMKNEDHFGKQWHNPSETEVSMADAGDNESIITHKFNCEHEDSGKAKLLEEVKNIESTLPRQEETEDKTLETFPAAPEDFKQFMTSEDKKTMNRLEDQSFVTNPREILDERIGERTIDLANERSKILDLQNVATTSPTELTEDNLLIEADGSELEYLKSGSGKPTSADALAGYSNADESRASEDIDASSSEETATTYSAKEVSNPQGTEGEINVVIDTKNEILETSNDETLVSNESTKEKQVIHEDASQMKYEEHLEEGKENSSLVLGDINNETPINLHAHILLGEDQRTAELLVNNKNTGGTLVGEEMEKTLGTLLDAPDYIKASKFTRDTETRSSDQYVTLHSQGSLSNQTEGLAIGLTDVKDRTPDSQHFSTSVSSNTDGTSLIQVEDFEMQHEEHLKSQIEKPAAAEDLTDKYDVESTIEHETNIDIEENKHTESIEKDNKMEDILQKPKAEAGKPIESPEIITKEVEALFSGLDKKFTSSIDEQSHYTDSKADETNDAADDTNRSLEDAKTVPEQIDSAVPVCGITNRPEVDCAIDAKTMIQEMDAVYEENSQNEKASTDIESSGIKNDENKVTTSEEVLPEDIETCIETANQSNNAENQDLEKKLESNEEAGYQKKEERDEAEDIIGKERGEQVQKHPEITSTSDDIDLKMIDDKSFITVDSEARVDETSNMFQDLSQHCEPFPQKSELVDQKLSEDIKKIPVEGKTADKYEREKTTEIPKQKENYPDPNTHVDISTSFEPAKFTDATSFAPEPSDVNSDGMTVGKAQSFSEKTYVEKVEMDPKEHTEDHVTCKEQEVEAQRNTISRTSQRETKEEHLIDVSCDVSTTEGENNKPEEYSEERKEAMIPYGEREEEKQQKLEAEICQEIGQEKLIKAPLSGTNGVGDEEADSEKNKEDKQPYVEINAVMQQNQEAEMHHNLEIATSHQEISEDKVANTSPEVSAPNIVYLEEAVPEETKGTQIPQGEREAEMQQNLEGGTGNKEADEEHHINASSEVSEPNAADSDDADPEESKGVQTPYAEREAEMHQNGSHKEIAGEQLISDFKEVTESKGVESEDEKKGAESIKEMNNNFSFTALSEVSSSNALEIVEMPQHRENKEAQNQHEDLSVPTFIKDSFMETENGIELLAATAEHSGITMQMQKQEAASLLDQDETRKVNTCRQESEVEQNEINKYVEPLQTEATIQNDLESIEKEQVEAKCSKENAKVDEKTEVTNEHFHESFEGSSHTEVESIVKRELTVTGDELATTNKSRDGNGEARTEKDKVKEEEQGEHGVSDFGSEALMTRETGRIDRASTVCDTSDEKLSCEVAEVNSSPTMERTDGTTIKKESSLKDILVNDNSVVGFETKSCDEASEKAETISTLMAGQAVKQPRPNETACETKAESAEDATDQGITSVPEDLILQSYEVRLETSSKIEQIVDESGRREDCRPTDKTNAEIGVEETSIYDNLHSNNSKENLEAGATRNIHESVAGDLVRDTITSEEADKARKEGQEAEEPQVKEEYEVKKDHHLDSAEKEIAPASHQEDPTIKTEEIFQVVKNSSESEEVKQKVPGTFEEDHGNDSITEKPAYDVNVVEEPGDTVLKNESTDTILDQKNEENVKDVTTTVHAEEVAQESDSVPLKIQNEDFTNKIESSSVLLRGDEADRTVADIPDGGMTENAGMLNENATTSTIVDAAAGKLSGTLGENMISRSALTRPTQVAIEDCDGNRGNQNSVMLHQQQIYETESSHTILLSSEGKELEGGAKKDEISTSDNAQYTNEENITSPPQRNEDKPGEADNWSRSTEVYNGKSCLEAEELDLTPESKDISESPQTDGAQDNSEVGESSTIKHEFPYESTESQRSTIVKNDEITPETTHNTEVQETKDESDTITVSEATGVACRTVESTESLVSTISKDFELEKKGSEQSKVNVDMQRTKAETDFPAIPEVTGSECKQEEKASDCCKETEENLTSAEYTKISRTESQLEKEHEIENQFSKLHDKLHEAEELQPAKASVTFSEQNATNIEANDLRNTSCHGLEEESGVTTARASPSNIFQGLMTDAAQGAKSHENEIQPDALPIVTDVKETAQIATSDGTNGTGLKPAPVPAKDKHLLLEADCTEKTSYEGSDGINAMLQPQKECFPVQTEIMNSSTVQYEQPNCAQNKSKSNEATKSSSDTETHSLSELLQASSIEQTLAKVDKLTTEEETVIHKEEMLAEKSDDRKAEGKTDEKKDYKEESGSPEHSDMSSEALIIVEAGDADEKGTHKKSHNILSGMGSKVKHSISKVKKAITGKSSHPKPPSPKQADKH